jgi:hydrogenase maturation factor
MGRVAAAVILLDSREACHGDRIISTESSGIEGRMLITGLEDERMR